jgi:hypothetical protein
MDRTKKCLSGKTGKGIHNRKDDRACHQGIIASRFVPYFTIWQATYKVK